jgi:putative sugar O-methyltransferase
LRFAAAKVRRAVRDGTVLTKAERQVRNLLWTPAWAIASDLKARDERLVGLREGFGDHRGTDRELRCSDDALHRICTAFQTADSDRGHAPEALTVRGLWAEWLDLQYGALRSLLSKGDVVGLRALLENLHREQLSIGVGGSIDDVSSTLRPAVRAYYRSLFRRYAALLEDVRPDWSDVSTPCAGNPHGILQGDRLVTLETLRYAHHATVLIESLGTAPVSVLEIGGGLGGQALQFIQLGRISRYRILDLPEVGALVAYVLIAALGEDRVCLYGETEARPVTISPPWTVDTLPDAGYSLVFNAYSFSEMDSRTAGYYLDQVPRLCTGLFFHVNHEKRFRYRERSGSVSVNLLGSELVPDSDHFSLAWRRPQLFVRPEQRARAACQYLFERQAAGRGAPRI